MCSAEFKPLYFYRLALAVSYAKIEVGPCTLVAAVYACGHNLPTQN